MNNYTVKQDEFVLSDMSTELDSFFVPPIQLSDDAKKLMTVLGRGGHFGYVWMSDTAGVLPKTTDWYSTSDSPEALTRDRRNYYFGVHPVNEIPKREKDGVALPPSSVRATVNDIAAINCLFGEFDQKDGWTFDKIQELDPKPSVVVSSGGGWHCYWILEEPALVTDENRNEIDQVQKAWVSRVGSDEGAKDLARVLRIPGTVNHKYDPARPVEILSANWEQVYDFDTLRNLVAESVTKEESAAGIIHASPTTKQDAAKALEALGRLSSQRADNYSQWTEVGMALRSLDEIGLALWENWSQKSEKYRPGECAAKWETFSKDGGLTLASLFYWADQDNPVSIKQARRGANVEDYEWALGELGFQFALNECDNRIMVNGLRIDDVIEKVMLRQLAKFGYKTAATAEIAWTYLADQNRYHPIVDYFQSLQWDGENHIAKLCSYIQDRDGLFEKWLTRWLVGSVAKVLHNPRGAQNRTLILAGNQNLGKSYFTRWLARPFPGYHTEASINPENKDDRLRRLQNFIWEIGELGSTTRKADREALKNFLSTEWVTDRFPYDKHDVYRPVLANYIGTINPEGGFLNDPTGSRRFMVCELESIDWDYAEKVDVSQLWAQAVALFQAGEPWNLTKDEQGLVNEINSRFQTETAESGYILRYFEIDPSQESWAMETLEVLDKLKRQGHSIGTNDNHAIQLISSALTQLGLRKVMRRTEDGGRARLWLGIRSNR